MSRVEQGTPDVVVEYGDKITVRSDGRHVVNSHFIVDEKTWGEMLAGYRCAWCLKDQSVAFPEQCEFEGTMPDGRIIRCSDLGPYPRGLIREHQSEYLAQQLRAMGDFTAPEPHETLDIEQDDWKPKSGIWLPGDAA